MEIESVAVTLKLSGKEYEALACLLSKLSRNQSKELGLAPDQADTVFMLAHDFAQRLHS